MPFGNDNMHTRIGILPTGADYALTVRVVRQRPAAMIASSVFGRRFTGTRLI
jgi:hypothetical protein